MSNIICIIDDQINLTIPIMKSLNIYCKKQKQIPNLIIKFVLMQDKNSENHQGMERREESLAQCYIEIEGEKARDYATEELSGTYTTLVESPTELINHVEVLKQDLGIVDDEDVVTYLLDLELFHSQDKKKLEQGEKCLSMVLYDLLIEQGNTCKLYSSYYEEPFMNEWMDVYQTTHEKHNVPNVFSREDLYPSCFNIKIGDEICHEFQ